MQKRYCSCGAEVMVDYNALAKNRWRSRFYAAKSEARVQVKVCPCCKRPLVIDALR